VQDHLDSAAAGGGGGGGGGSQSGALRGAELDLEGCWMTSFVSSCLLHGRSRQRQEEFWSCERAKVAPLGELVELVEAEAVTST